MVQVQGIGRLLSLEYPSKFRNFAVYTLFEVKKNVRFSRILPYFHMISHSILLIFEVVDLNFEKLC